ncbi:SNF2 family N-terminal domain-containing protein [Mucidula mucida]|nr:SNF2 family N-terminal domain-containing protein [Mucidula mucida]
MASSFSQSISSRCALDHITQPVAQKPAPLTHGTPSMSTFTSYNQKPAMVMPMAPSIFSPPPLHNGGPPPHMSYRPPFAGPSHSPAPPIQAPPPQSNHVIDLTSSPSPPPMLPPEMSPKTPPEWATVKLQYEHSEKPGSSPNTIHIKAGTGESFAITEQKVADNIGHMIGKGLIRLEAKVRKGPPNLPILPLHALVFTPKGNVPVVGQYLHQCSLLLDHPATPFNYHDILQSKTPYLNPHNPPPGGHNRNLIRPGAGMYAPSGSRWTTPQVAGKTTEVQRSQVDELFKNLKTGEELRETEPAPEVATKLYPHQKKALTFLLDREKERPSGTAFLRMRSSWVNLVTQKEMFSEPEDSKGAILADDMGLGKTITCVSLIAATIDSADKFVATPVAAPPGVGMPPPVENNAKAKAKAQREQEKLESEYLRASRIKAKSRATLIICPLSTVSNWEDQFREHWKGEVTVVGGGGTHSESRRREGRPLRVYIYHGNARRPEPDYLADFDAVITTYSTLASEYSKQNRSVACAEEEEEDCGGASSDGGGVEVDDRGNQILRLPKPKKGGVKRKKSGLCRLQSIHWFRVVLDEAHCIKETGTVGSRASCDLVADRRTKLDDVFALVKFLRIDPLDEKGVWTEFIGAPVKFGQTLGIARLQTLMSTITLRRTKESKTLDGKRILSLPPRRDELRMLKFDAQEQAIYDQFFNASKAEFNEMSDKNEVMKNYEAMSFEDMAMAIQKEGFSVPKAVAIWAILREAATTQCVECGAELSLSTDGPSEDDGVDAPVKKGKKPKASANTSRAPTRANSPAVPIAVLTRCQHLFCVGCFRQCVHPGWPHVSPDVCRSCSTCQTGLYLDTTKKKPVKRERRQKGSGMNIDIHPSTKVKALLGDLIAFSKANPNSVNYDPNSIEVQMVDEQGRDVVEDVVKTVVFSQWTTMLDKIEDALEAAGIRYDRLDGTMKRDERIRAMDALKHDPGCEVLLVSLKAGGVGLNLTAAQRVYLMDPYWNPAVENQAVDRIHRLGQTRPVTTIKLIIENSIEARLLDVQRKKTELANMTLGSNFSKAELMKRRMEELNQLFEA